MNREKQTAAPDRIGADRIDAVVNEALADDGRLAGSGCVVCVGHRGGKLFLKAYGDKKTDTVFDLASLTKPVATATAIMLLAQRGRVRTMTPVAEYLHEFDTPGKREITVRHLLTHTGGFPQGPGDYSGGAAAYKARLLAMNPANKPGTHHEYSCASYIMLGEIVERVSGQNLHAFTRENIFAPLGMNETCFVPGEALSRRAAILSEPVRKAGHVHDHQAYTLGGIVGNAGLFSTADDLALFATMMLNGGALPGGARIMDEATVAEMTAPNPVPGGFRGLGWAMRCDGTVHRPSRMSSAAYGHGGFTGNAFWLDPEPGIFTIFLSNKPGRVMYPDASKIGDIAIEWSMING